ncbi:MAG: AIM24 family protein, partial [Pseudomonadota bacterium]
PLVGYAVARLAPPAENAAGAAGAMWVGSTARLAIGDEIFVRADAAVACTGSARWEAAHRRVRGRSTPQRLGGDDRPFFRVTGRGELFVAAPAGSAGRLVPLLLDDDSVYLREDRVLAFEGSVSWEYGHVPRGDLRMLQFRGRGVVAIRAIGEPGAVKVTPDKPLFAAAPHLLGWIGRVVARGGPAGQDGGDGGDGGDGAASTTPAASPFGITCEGEGVVLIDIAEGARS